MHAFLSLGPFVVLTSLFLGALWRWDISMLIWAVCFFGFGLLSNLGLKHLALRLGLRHSRLLRPSLCPQRKGEFCERCSMLPDWQLGVLKGEQRLGFPSGHAQSMWMAAAAWAAARASVSEFHHHTMAWILCAYAAAVCFQRVHSKCHSPLQVFVGSVLGVIIGVALAP